MAGNGQAFDRGQFFVHGDCQQRAPQRGKQHQHQRTAAEDPGQVGGADGQQVTEQVGHQVDAHIVHEAQYHQAQRQSAGGENAEQGIGGQRLALLQGHQQNRPVAGSRWSLPVPGCRPGQSPWPHRAKRHGTGCRQNRPCAAIPRRNPAGRQPAPGTSRQARRREENQPCLECSPCTWVPGATTEPYRSWLLSWWWWYMARLGAVLPNSSTNAGSTADLLGVVRAAHVTVQAHHLVGGAHHQVQVVGHHQHAAAMAVAQAGDEVVQLGLADHVHTLHRFVENQHLGFAQQGAGQQHALYLVAGNGLDRADDDLFGAHFLQRRQGCGAVYAGHQAQEAQHRQRQRGIDLNLLRHVANAQLRLAPYFATVRLEQPEYGAHQGGLARPVGADQGDDLAGCDRQVDAVEHRLAAKGDADLLQADQGIATAALRQLRTGRPLPRSGSRQ
uniref:Glucose-binding protein n=1 Tax=Pseudomonas putida TaxID=303 RepID=Q9Z422_PSEPU|nr:glucose-binding protein [Pseudomonas putida]